MGRHDGNIMGSLCLRSAEWNVQNVARYANYMTRTRTRFSVKPQPRRFPAPVNKISVKRERVSKEERGGGGWEIGGLDPSRH